VIAVPKTILVPVDFSEAAETALEYAVMLAGKLDAKIYVLNVLGLRGTRVFDFGAPLTPDVVDKLVEANQAGLDRLVDKYRATGRIAGAELRTGEPREVIESMVRETRADLIVMGTHGRRGFKDALLGSVAGTIVRTASCPVLTVRPGTEVAP
jgi:nucleotide-binding universal stress UspA family protein